MNGSPFKVVAQINPSVLKEEIEQHKKGSNEPFFSLVIENEVRTKNFEPLPEDVSLDL